MPDFEGLAALRGPRLADLPVHVRDVLALNLAAEEEYQVGRVSMAAFEFVPYALTGLSAAMRTPATGARATTRVTIPIVDDAGGAAVAERDVTLYGPGDVLGIDPGQVVRRYPTPGTVNAEETFHAHIEFDRPELPWAFSAHTPKATMPAWLALVVLEASEVTWEPAQAGLQPILSVQASCLPPLDTAWAWAHAQAAAGTSSLSARLSTAYAPVNVSRLLAARILTHDTDYVACLVPTTDAGVRAGLGLPAGTLEPAWTAQSGQVRLPVYDRWQFRTAPDGDFERLARRLVGVAAPWEIGRRVLDAGRPGAPLDDLGADEPGRRQVIRCALYSPAPPPPGAPPEDVPWSAERTGALRAALERPALIEGTAGTDPGAVPDLPIVGPRLYARGQRGTGTVALGDWFAELNLAPTHRVVAGLGTRVVIRDQEPLMQAAWAQVGQVERANRALALAELSRHLAGAVHRRLAQVDPGRLLQMTRPVASRVRLEGAALTLAGQTARSATPSTALGGAVRRALRVGGPVTRHLAAPQRVAAAKLVSAGSGARDFSRPYAEIDGIRGLSATAIATLDPGRVALALGVPEDAALATVRRASQTVSASLSLATAVSTPDSWQPADVTVRPGDLVARRVVDRIQSALPAAGVEDSVRTRWLGGLAAGLADSRVTGTEGLRDVALALDERVVRAAERVAVAGGSAGAGGGAGAAAGAAGGAGAAGVVVAPGRAGSAPGRTGATPGRIGGGLARGAGAEILRGGAIRGSGVGSAIGGSGVGGAIRGAGGGSAIGGVESLVRELPGGALGSIIRPQVPAGGVDAALAVPVRERLDRIRTPQGTALATWLEQATAVSVTALRAELTSLVDGPGALALAPTPVRPRLAAPADELLGRLDPGRTVVGAMRARLNLGRLAFDVFAESMIRPIMAAPRFDRPMYQALDAYDREWLVPGLGTLPEPEMVTLLSTNDAFTEAFLVGLSDEMGRELLWRQYPTDARGTYFHRFWDPAHDELVGPIHRFRGGRLGSHVTVGGPGQSGRAVVVIRGELVRRYPDLTVMAMKQQTVDGRPVLPDVATADNAAPSLFHAMLPPDVLLAGLDISVDALRTGGWWIVLAEHPQATRFRRLEADLVGHEVDFTRPRGAEDGAQVAVARLAQPVRVAFEADDFLPPHP